MPTNPAFLKTLRIISEPIYLRERDVVDRYRVGRSWFRELVQAKVFPEPKRLGARMSVWSREELDVAFGDPELPNIIAQRNEEKRLARKAASP